jgi:hypothetical protein
MDRSAAMPTGTNSRRPTCRSHYGRHIAVDIDRGAQENTATRPFSFTSIVHPFERFGGQSELWVARQKIPPTFAGGFYSPGISQAKWARCYLSSAITALCLPFVSSS